ncbi:MAG: DNA primase [Clostridia bacterium]|nr:DNA primase [Clostridia bacterium]
MIPNSIIEDIRYRCDIEDVISSYVSLKRAGSNVKGLCPFHSEKTPSFVVYKDTQSFYCFGCGAGGDVISFIMRQENLDYVSAVEFLAKRAGIALPEFDSHTGYNDGPGRARILQMNVEAAKYFRSMLFDENTGAPARQYLKGKRALESSVVKHFGLGYAPLGWNNLRDHLRSLGFTYDEMVAANLCSKGEKSCYDFFRGRVMFPIIDVSGNIVAFGGRVLDDSKPKYLNSAETAAFRKNKNLFALNFARNSSEDTMIICEGYMDVIALHAAGFTNAVATLGTAITSEHARIIKRYVSKAVLAYDGDEAGRKAADRAIRLLGEAGVDSRILVMRDAKDPDEFIKKFGREAFRKLIDESRSRFDYIIETVLKKYNLENADDKIKAAGELCAEIASVYSKVERDIYIQKTATALAIDPKSVKHDVDRLIGRNASYEKKRQTEELIRVTSGISDRVNPDYAKSPKAGRLEEEILGILMLHPEYVSIKIDDGVLCEDDFFTGLGRRLFAFIKAKMELDGFSIGMLSEEFSNDEVSRAVSMQTARRDLSNDTDAYKTYSLSLRNETSKKSDMSLEDVILKKRQTK